MILNFNVGLLGHVDSGKTSLARALSSIASTAAFDKDPQSQRRGITLDLGFSALKTSVPPHLLELQPELKELQLTFVDCPGHASLIKTAIGGAQIIDLMLLVIDVQKGMQTQSAECLIIAEMLERKLIVVLNKIDLLTGKDCTQQAQKVEVKLRKTFAKTSFGADVPILCVSAVKNISLQLLMDKILSAVYMPKRNVESPFLMYVDHCFSIKGQGTILTGTVMQGRANINDTIEIPMLRTERKIKQIQMHHTSMPYASMGDRIGLCVTQLTSQQIERSIACKPGYLRPVYAVCISLQRISYYKNAITSRKKLHITVAHDTIMGNIILLKPKGAENKSFERAVDYEYIDQLEESDAENDYLALIEFDRAVLVVPNAMIIASKLDVDTSYKGCRLAFWGRVIWFTHVSNYIQEELFNFRIFKSKVKYGYVQRILDSQHIIIDGMFKKQSDRNIFVGMKVDLSTGEQGIIESTFGQSSKLKIFLINGLDENTQNMPAGNIKIFLNFKKHLFDKNMKCMQ